MKDILVLEKRIGETPLQCVERFRGAHPEYAGVKMTYAGRLDPVAEGVLVVLAGDRVHNKEQFLKLPKTYECTALVGVGTDTYDVLGVPTHSARVSVPPPPDPLLIKEGEAEHVLRSFIGTFSQPYPPYSSKTVLGKQLHTHARQGTLADIPIPEQQVTVSDICILEVKQVPLRAVVTEIGSIIDKVSGDFRQVAIKDAWGCLLRENPEKTVDVLTFSITVSGGTYIRGIVDVWGKKIGKNACILRLKRTRVGEYGVLDIDI
jgi:tRNA pseudouridine(55) synthase